MNPTRPRTIYADAVCDLFHAGHVGLFEQARALGDRLIVGLVSDADVATYKPPPIMTLAERRRVVEACRLVDEVVDAPLFCTCAFLDAIGADLACHGDDMDEAELRRWYGDVIAGGRFQVLRYTAGVSSRDIVARVLARRGGVR